MKEYSDQELFNAIVGLLADIPAEDYERIIGEAKTERDHSVVTDLAYVFRFISPKNIDGILAKAKELIAARANPVSRVCLGELFDAQLKILKELGCIDDVRFAFMDQRDAVLKKAEQNGYQAGRVPFIPVIPVMYLSLYSQYEMLRKRCTMICRINLETVVDIKITPRRPYYIFGVDPGSYICRGVLESVRKIRKAGRLPLVFIEALAVCLHTQALETHSVEALASRYVGGKDLQTGIERKAIPVFFPKSLEDRLLDDEDLNQGGAASASSRGLD